MKRFKDFVSVRQTTDSIIAKDNAHTLNCEIKELEYLLNKDWENLFYIFADHKSLSDFYNPNTKKWIDSDSLNSWIEEEEESQQIPNPLLTTLYSVRKRDYKSLLLNHPNQSLFDPTSVDPNHKNYLQPSVIQKLIDLKKEDLKSVTESNNTDKFCMVISEGILSTAFKSSAVMLRGKQSSISQKVIQSKDLNTKIDLLSDQIKSLSTMVLLVLGSTASDVKSMKSLIRGGK